MQDFWLPAYEEQFHLSEQTLWWKSNSIFHSSFNLDREIDFYLSVLRGLSEGHKCNLLPSRISFRLLFLRVKLSPSSVALNFSFDWTLSGGKTVDSSIFRGRQFGKVCVSGSVRVCTYSSRWFRSWMGARYPSQQATLSLRYVYTYRQRHQFYSCFLILLTGNLKGRLGV